jgi:hypothetical protein
LCNSRWRAIWPLCCTTIRHDAAAMRFVRAFFDTLQREWPLLDSHRMDKFYYLLSQVQREIFRFLARRHWSTPLATELRDALATSVLAVGGMAFAGISLALGRHFSPSMHAIARDERTDPGAALAVARRAAPSSSTLALARQALRRSRAAESFFDPLLTAEATEDRFGADSLTRRRRARRRARLVAQRRNPRQTASVSLLGRRAHSRRRFATAPRPRSARMVNQKPEED